MKTVAFGFAAALALGIASFVAPASAAPQLPASALAGAAHADVTQAYYVRRPHYRRGPVCTWRTVVSHGPYGRHVRQVRVCR